MSNYHGLYGAPGISGSDLAKYADPKSIPTSSSNGLYNDGSLNPSSISSSNGLSGLGNLQDKYMQHNGLDKPATFEDKSDLMKEVEMKSESPAPSLPSQVAPYNPSVYQNYGSSAFHPSSQYAFLQSANISPYTNPAQYPTSLRLS